jgi:methyl-accepting chemotaxis protein
MSTLPRPSLSQLMNPNNLTVRAALIQAAVWVVIGNAAVMVAFLISSSIERAAINESQAAAEVRQQADRIYAQIYQLSAMEERIIRIKDLSLVAEHTAIHTSASEDVEQLIAITANEPEVQSAARDIAATLKEYKTAMAELIEIQEHVGVSQDTGLTGELVSISSAVEFNTNALNDDRLAFFQRRVQGAERGYTQSRNPDFLVPFEKNLGRFRTMVERASVDEAAKAALLGEIDKYLETMTEFVNEEQHLVTALAALKDLADSIPPVVQSIRDSSSERAETAASNAASMRTIASATVLGAALLVALVLITGFVWLIRRIAPALKDAVAACEAISDGDLTVRVPQDRNDEIGDVFRALHGMAGRLDATIAEVRESAVTIQQSATELAASNDYLSQRTEQSAASLEETASSMEEMTSTVRQNADNARSASGLAVEAKQLAEGGASVVKDAIAAMNEINDASKQMETVIAAVNEIAFQTNLLALNAAVEAARAGEAGRGFAVVASEVRTLAARSADAANQVKTLIGTSTEKVGSGSALVSKAGAVLEQIIAGVQQVSSSVAEIDSASQEQSDGIGQVNTAVLEMDNMTQQNAAMVEESAAAARAMDEQARYMLDRVSYFKTSGIPREQAGEAPLALPTSD